MTFGLISSPGETLVSTTSTTSTTLSAEKSAGKKQTKGPLGEEKEKVESRVWSLDVLSACTPPALLPRVVGFLVKELRLPLTAPRRHPPGQQQGTPSIATSP